MSVKYIHILSSVATVAELWRQWHNDTEPFLVTTPPSTSYSPGKYSLCDFCLLPYCNSLAGIKFPLILYLLRHAGSNMNFRKSMWWDMKQEWSNEPLGHLEFIGNVNSHLQHPLNPSRVLARQYVNIRLNRLIKWSIFW